jgi:hypothetical protein
MLAAGIQFITKDREICDRTFQEKGGHRKWQLSAM